MLLFHVKSKIQFNNYLGDKIRVNVFVMAENKEEAKEKAIILFKHELIDQDQNFDELKAMTNSERDLVYEDDISIYALFMAACGDVDIDTGTEYSKVDYF
jgi:hypothetical protein